MKIKWAWSVNFAFILACYLSICVNSSFARNEEKINFDRDGVLQDNVLEEMNESIVFVILAHVRNYEEDLLWRRCYQSIRGFYPDVDVIIIDDNSPIPVQDGNLTHTTIISSEYPGAGELLPYYYFLKGKWADKMIFLHDSMFLRRPFTFEELVNPVKFHWYFADHRWLGSDDILRFLNHLSHARELLDFSQSHSPWYGCFGVTSIISLNVLEQIETKYSFTETLIHLVHTRPHRMALERILAILIFKEGYVNIGNCSNFGNIFDYPFCYTDVKGDRLEFLHENYPGAILKTWRGR